jgi:hypothetical protein
MEGKSDVEVVAVAQQGWMMHLWEDRFITCILLSQAGTLAAKEIFNRLSMAQVRQGNKRGVPFERAEVTLWENKKSTVMHVQPVTSMTHVMTHAERLRGFLHAVIALPPEL